MRQWTFPHHKKVNWFGLPIFAEIIYASLVENKPAERRLRIFLTPQNQEISEYRITNDVKQKKKQNTENNSTPK